MVAMQAASLEVLEKANVPPGQARAIVQAIEIEIAGAKETHPTKTDLQLLRFETREESQSLRQEIVAFRQETKQEFASVRQEMKDEFVSLRQEMKDEFASVRQEMNQALDSVRHETASLRQETNHELASEFGKLRLDMTEMRASLEVKIESLGKEVHSVARDNLRTMMTVTIGSMTSVLAVVLGVVYFLFAHGPH